MKGLSQSFSLQNGKFVLTADAQKAKDNVYFLMLFDSVDRVYYSDFAPRLLFLVQKTGATVTTFKTILLGRLRKVLLKYVDNIRINSLDLKETRINNAKEVEIILAYEYRGVEVVEDTFAKFI